VYDVKKYAENDLLFCKSQILKAIESNEQENKVENSKYTVATWSADRNLDNLSYKTEFSLSSGGIYVGFDLIGDINSSTGVEFDYQKPDGSIHVNKGIMSFEKPGMFSGRVYLDSPKSYPAGTWKIIVFIDGNKLTETTFKIK
jgi:hypothetical protein